MLPALSSMRRGLMCGAAALAVAAGLATPTLAWKPKTHVYLAEEAVRDAVVDGKVTIYETHYGTGKIVGELGQFDVDPKILAALKAAPKQYRAGVLGPDAYPDILTGQQIIHPDEAEAHDGSASGSDAWLTHLWTQGFRGTADAKINAFTVGYLAHAAGDVFAHTYVNHYAGGEFMLTPDPRNALRHLVLEGYVGKRTPATMSAAKSRIAVGKPCNQRKADDLEVDPAECGVTYKDIYPTITGEDTSIEGVSDFIYRELTYAAPGSLLEQKLMKGAGTEKSIPFIYSTLRNKLQAELAEYDRVLASKSGADRVAFELLNGGAAEDKRKRIARIDAGLAAFPAVSHEVAKAIVYNEQGADIAAAKAALGTYVRDHLAVMAGSSNGLKNTVFTVADVVSAIMPKPLLDLIGEMMAAPLDLLVKGVTGKNAEEWGQYLKNPELRFDEVLMRPGGGHDGEIEHNIDLRTFNREQLKLDDDGYANPSLKWKVEDLPPAFNTLQLNKMLLLGDAGRAQLAAALKAKGAPAGALPPAGGNVMLGWVRSLDKGNQWQGIKTHRPGPSPQPFFSAGGGAAYKKLFLIQIGEKGAEPEHGSSPAPTEPTSPGWETPATPAPETPTPGSGGWGQPTPTTPTPVPPADPVPDYAKTVSVADILGTWTSPAGEFTITKGGDGAFAELSGPGGDFMIELTPHANGRSFVGEWRHLAGGAAGRISLTPQGKASFTVARDSGGTLGGGATGVFTATRGAAAPPATPGAPAKPVPTPPKPAPPVSSGPILGGGGPVGGGYRSVSKHWDVAFEGAQAHRDSELHVVVSVKNMTDSDLHPTPGSFIPKVKNADGEWLTSRDIFRATGEPTSGFRPSVPPGESVRIRFIFRPAAQSAQLTTFSLGVFEGQTHSWDLSGVRLGSLAP